MTKPNVTPNKNNKQVPGTPPVDDNFESKTFTARIIKPSALKSALDLTYNEIILRQLMIQVEAEMEKYHIMRLSLMREAATRDKAGLPQDTDALASEEAENLRIENTKITNDLL